MSKKAKFSEKDSNGKLCVDCVECERVILVLMLINVVQAISTKNLRK